MGCTTELNLDNSHYYGVPLVRERKLLGLPLQKLLLTQTNRQLLSSTSPEDFVGEQVETREQVDSEKALDFELIFKFPVNTGKEKLTAFL